MLHPPLRVPVGAMAVLGGLGAVLLGALFAGDGEAGVVDAQVWAALEGRKASWRHAALVVDFLGEPVGAALLVGGVVAGCLLRRCPYAAVFAVVGTGTAVGATTLGKPLVGRTIHEGSLAYPSGHTAFLTALALVLALLAAGRLDLGRAAGTALVLAAALVAGAAMGWAQAALGRHYPTDTLGGWCTALAVTPASAWIVDRAAGSRRQRKCR